MPSQYQHYWNHVADCVFEEELFGDDCELFSSACSGESHISFFILTMRPVSEWVALAEDFDSDFLLSDFFSMFEVDFNFSSFLSASIDLLSDWLVASPLSASIVLSSSSHSAISIMHGNSVSRGGSWTWFCLRRFGGGAADLADALQNSCIRFL